MDIERNENTEWYINIVLQYGFDRTANLAANEYLDEWDIGFGEVEQELQALGYTKRFEDWTDGDWDMMEHGISWAEQFIIKQLEE